MATHDELKKEMETYLQENEKFNKYGYKSSATKARNALSAIMKLSKTRRAEILEESKAEKE